MAVTEFAKHMGSLWGTMSDEDKQPYVAEHARLKIEYEEHTASAAVRAATHAAEQAKADEKSAKEREAYTIPSRDDIIKDLSCGGIALAKQAARARAALARTKELRKLLKGNKSRKKEKKKDKEKVKPGKKVKQVKPEKGVYMVEELLQKRLYYHPDLGKEIVQYKVKWVGFKLSSSTWEPAWNLSHAVIEEFEASQDASGKLAEELQDQDEDEDEEEQNFERLVLRKCSNELCTNIEIQPCQFEACAGCLPPAGKSNADSDENGDGDWRIKNTVAVVYCSVACQREAWPAHKLVCNATAGKDTNGDDDDSALNEA